MNKENHYRTIWNTEFIIVGSFWAKSIWDFVEKKKPGKKWCERPKKTFLRVTGKKIAGWAAGRSPLSQRLPDEISGVFLSPGPELNSCTYKVKPPPGRLDWGGGWDTKVFCEKLYHTVCLEFNFWKVFQKVQAIEILLGLRHQIRIAVGGGGKGNHHVPGTGLGHRYASKGGWRASGGHTYDGSEKISWGVENPRELHEKR